MKEINEKIVVTVRLLHQLFKLLNGAKLKAEERKETLTMLKEIEKALKYEVSFLQERQK